MIIAAADGSSLSNPGPAGWAWYVDDDTWAAGGWPVGTNNMAELMAVLDLLQSTAHTGEPLRVLCDSQYVINSLTKWLPGWKRRGWRKGDGKPVLNVDLMKELDRALQGRDVQFEWVKGHAGHALNEAADERARAAAAAFRDGVAPDPGPGYPSARTAAREAIFEPRTVQEEPDLFSFDPSPMTTPGTTVEPSARLTGRSDRRDSSMANYRVGYFVGSLSSTSINRVLSKALISVAPDDLEFTEIPIGDLPLYSSDYDADYPPEGRALKDAIAGVQAVLFVTPEYNRSIPGALKNAIDWASRPWGQNSFDHMPAAMIGASIGNIGTAVAQQSLRAVLAFCNARQMTAPEAYIHFDPEAYGPDGEVLDDGLRGVLTEFMSEFRDHVERVLTVLPRA